MFDTVIAGSLPKRSWLAETQKLWPQWKASGPKLAQAKLDATLMWIKTQEEDAGRPVAAVRAGLSGAGKKLDRPGQPGVLPLPGAARHHRTRAAVCAP